MNNWKADGCDVVALVGGGRWRAVASAITPDFATLMAAAPELLEVLAAVREAIESGENVGALVPSIKATIAKARGKK